MRQDRIVLILAVLSLTLFISSSAFAGAGPAQIANGVVSGVIRTVSGAPVAGVGVYLYVSGHLQASTTTNAEGRYTFNSLPMAYYCVAPAQLGATFEPAYRGVPVPPGSTTADFTGRSVTNVISGVIRTVGGTLVAGIKVYLYLSGQLQATATTNAYGRYVFSGLPNGYYGVAPAHAGATFDPQYRHAAVPPGTTTADFTVASNTFAIAGFIKTAAGSPVAGVGVVLYQNNTPRATTTTNSVGWYGFTNLASGAYSVKPHQSGAAFTPEKRDVTVGPSTGAANFTVAYGISGLIKSPSAVPLVGVEVGLFQGETRIATATTGADGRYAFTNVALGAYVVRPLGELLTFDPIHRAVTVPPGTTAANFTGGFVVAGTVRTAGGAGVSGVTVTLSEGATVKGTATTNASGRYYILNQNPGNYSAQPALTGKVFTPPSRDVAIPPSSGTVDFTCGDAPAGISGVLKTAGDTPVAGVTVKLFQGETEKFATTTDANGHYEFATLPIGEYSVRPVGEMLCFDPANRAVAVPPGSTTANFTVGYVIAGTIRNNAGAALGGVGVKLTQGATTIATTHSLSSGRYYFVMVAPGTYTVQPSQEGVLFDPASRVVTVPPGVSNADFTAAGKVYIISGVVRTSGGHPLAGVTVKLYIGEALQGTTTSGTGGRYYFVHLGESTYTVRPEHEAYHFTPSSRNVTCPPGSTSADFTVSSGGSVIAGTIRDSSSQPLGGVKVELLQGTTVVATVYTFASTGRYYFLNVADGDYEVKPALDGYTFTPESLDVTVPGDYLFGNFVGATAG